MGQYQTRTVKSLEELEEPGGLRNVGESLNEAQQQEPAPPVFGSPIDSRFDQTESGLLSTDSRQKTY